MLDSPMNANSATRAAPARTSSGSQVPLLRQACDLDYRTSAKGLRTTANRFAAVPLKGSDHVPTIMATARAEVFFKGRNTGTDYLDVLRAHNELIASSL